MRSPQAPSRPRGPRRGVRYDPEALIAAGKWSPAQEAKIRKVMDEFKAGTLESSNGSKVTNKKQALAIALSEARGLTAAAFDESKHKRHPRGDERGGQFAPKEVGRKTAESVVEETRQKHGEEGVKELLDYELSEEGRARGREMSEEPEEYHEGWEERLREEQTTVSPANDERDEFPDGSTETSFSDEEFEAEAARITDEVGQQIDESMSHIPDDEAYSDEASKGRGYEDQLSEEISMGMETYFYDAIGDYGISDFDADRLAKEVEKRLEQFFRGNATASGALTAAAAGLAPMVPPKTWFDKPTLDGPTPITVTADGRVFGHAALWGTCHTGMPGVCRTPPRSESGYRFFHLGEVETDGGPVHVGRVTMDTGHAPLTASKEGTIRHYDNTGTGAAHVRAYEDEHGIVLAGALMPDIPAEKARRLKGATVSGDWRSIGGKLEMVGMLAVNVPGFPVPRAMAASLMVEDEPHTMALVAAGMYHDPDDDDRRLKALTARALGGVDGLVELAMGGDKLKRRMGVTAAVPGPAPPEQS